MTTDEQDINVTRLAEEVAYHLAQFAPRDAGKPDDVVQIIPGDNWFAVYQGEITDDDGVTGTFRLPLAAWGLLRNGQVVPLAVDSTGIPHRADSASNFLDTERDGDRR